MTCSGTPRPERAARAIWAGRAAQRRGAASTGRGWASTSEHDKAGRQRCWIACNNVYAECIKGFKED